MSSTQATTLIKEEEIRFFLDSEEASRIEAGTFDRRLDRLMKFQNRLKFMTEIEFDQLLKLMESLVPSGPTDDKSKEKNRSLLPPSLLQKTR